MSQLSQRRKVLSSSESLWIYSALYTAQFSRNLESRGSVAKVGTRAYTKKLERLRAGQMDDPNTRTGGWWSHPLSWAWMALLSKLESSTPEMHLESFISICLHSLKSSDMSTALENPSVRPQASKKGWESERESSPFSTTFSKMFMKFFWAMPLRDVSCDFAISSNSCG